MVNPLVAAMHTASTSPAWAQAHRTRAERIDECLAYPETGVDFPSAAN